ncbi:hypothetical protein ACFHYQ_14755 [Sphaerimonospora cavernae]|uniref:Uncharacterized protein n=1 Tax=Sphaerimonospora cavernae TaxID=1740611 RepID=A0ABV6U532_9ACTN
MDSVNTAPAVRAATWSTQAAKIRIRKLEAAETSVCSNANGN